MSITQHRYASLALGILSLVLLICLLRCLGQFHQYRADVRYAHDIVWSYQANRDSALKADVAEAVCSLQRLSLAEGQPSPFSGSLSNYVEGQRRRAVLDTLAYLRAKTGKDLGADPEAWIQQYGKK